MFPTRQDHLATNEQQTEHSEGNLYESFPAANFDANAQQGYNAQSFPTDSAAWATGAGLPDDDDPILQHRLQELVEQHKPSTSRNVLRELADVAEQQSTPSGNKRKGFEDDTYSDDDDDVDTRKPPAKQRKSIPVESLSRARRQMDEAISKRRALCQSIWDLEAQLKSINDQLSANKAKLSSVEQTVFATAEELVNELLEENTTWNQMYFHLMDFRNRNGHLRVPWRKDGKEKDPIAARLGPWLVQQRKDYRRDADDPERLEPYKILALEKINIEWEPFRQHWSNRFEDLKRFKLEHGHCRVPYCSGRSQKKLGKEDTDVVEDEEVEEGEEGGKVKYDSLGVWVKRQRSQYKNFKAGNKEKAGEITEERIKLLDSIGFEWSLRTGSAESSWTDCYNEAKSFKDKHGHTRVDEKTDKHLCEWIKQMRGYLKKYREGGGDSGLSPEQIALLKELELDFSLRESKFGARFAELMEFKSAHGHCIVPAAYAANQKLSNWVQTQKRQYKLMKEGRKSQMTEEKSRILAAAGFEFEVSKERKSEAMKLMEKSWNEFFAELQRYKAKYGQVNFIKQRKKKALREWCDEQRVQHTRMKWGKTCSITESQIRDLTALGFDWTASDTPSKGWDDYYGDLLTFYIENSSFNIPDDEDDLKHWVETQKLEYKKFVSGVPSLLTKSRIKKLDDVSFPFGVDGARREALTPPKRSWEEMFGQLLAFKIRNNTFCVPKEMKELHEWTCQQRQQEKLIQSNRKSGTKRSAIWEERVRRLSEVGFDWGGELPSKVPLHFKSTSFDPNVADVTNAARDCMMHQMAAINNVGYAVPTWAGGIAMSPFSGTTNVTPGHMHVSPHGVFQSLTDPTISGKRLASQAAQIVADINNRNPEPHSTGTSTTGSVATS